MRNFRIFLIIFCLILGNHCFAAKAWLNDLRSLYLSKQANIYEINIRTFNSLDKNGNGIIEQGEQRGNFINAIKRLDELADAGINTIKIMPVLPVSKTKAMGTAGSLYAPVEFNKINPQLQSSKTSAYDDMVKFVSACHKRKLRVIVELPCCAGYDLYVKNPKLFFKDASGSLLSPEGDHDKFVLNPQSDDVYRLYKDFIINMFDIGVDGISFEMPETKPLSFWKKLLADVRKLDSEMLFIAETRSDSKELFNGYMPILSKSQLLDAGFDGYSGEYKNIKDLNKEFFNIAKSDFSASQKSAVLADFSPYYMISPAITKGSDYAKQLIWLLSALPVNLHYLDGFTTGDNYMYTLSNKKASYSLTDDKYYSMKRGQMDIYNFSRKPEGSDYTLFADYVVVNKFRIMAAETISKGNFNILKTNNSNILAYSRSFNGSTVIIIANTAKSEFEKIKIKVPKINSDIYSIPIKVAANVPVISKGEIVTNMAPFETQVMLFQNFNIK